MTEETDKKQEEQEKESLTDEELVLLFQDGDNAAFEVLFSRYNSGIHRFVHLMVTHYSQSYDEVDDIVLDVWIRIYERTRQSEKPPISNFRHFAIMTAKLVCMKHIRKMEKERITQVGFRRDYKRFLEDSAKLAEDDRKAQAELVNDVLNKLDRKDVNKSQLAKVLAGMGLGLGLLGPLAIAELLNHLPTKPKDRELKSLSQAMAALLKGKKLQA